jgi:23S rRNA (uracil1939-C5)-methyltransferase
MSRTDDRRSALSIPMGPLAGDVIELEITSLAAGGDGVARDAGGRVTFVPRTAPGDRVRARVVKTTSTLAYAEMIELVEASPARVEPPCPHFELGCGGCAWQHVARDEQLRAKQTIVSSALRRLAQLDLHPIRDPAPPLGWRRRARFHVVGGHVGLYELGTRDVLPIQHCPQLEPALDVAYAMVRSASPPDGELALVIGQAGEVAVGVQKPWRLGERIVGRAGVKGVVTPETRYGMPLVEIEPALSVEPWDFAQASAAGNAALIEIVRGAVGQGPGRLVELFAGGGNFTRAFIVDDWDIVASDVTAPSRTLPVKFIVGEAAAVLEKNLGVIDVLVLDPPRTGAADCIDAIVRLAPPKIVYISCDPATLARDAEKLVAAGYHATDAWPVDLMPQTAHVEVVLRLVRDGVR